MAEDYIIDAVRTPRGDGKPGKGALSHLRAMTQGEPMPGEWPSRTP